MAVAFLFRRVYIRSVILNHHPANSQDGLMSEWVSPSRMGLCGRSQLAVIRDHSELLPQHVKSVSQREGETISLAKEGKRY